MQNLLLRYFEKILLPRPAIYRGDYLFIKNEISDGRYGSASEVIRDTLRVMEERKSKLEALRHHLAKGAEQAKQESS